MKITLKRAVRYISFAQSVRINAGPHFSSIADDAHAESAAIAKFESQAQADESYPNSSDTENTFQSTEDILDTVVLLERPSQSCVFSAVPYVGAEINHSTDYPSQVMATPVDRVNCGVAACRLLSASCMVRNRRSSSLKRAAHHHASIKSSIYKLPRYGF